MSLLPKYLNNSVTLLTCMACMCVFIVWVYGGVSFIFELFIFLIFIVLLATHVSPKLILSKHLAVPVCSKKARLIYTIVGDLSQRAKLKKPPQIFYIKSPEFIAFTVGGYRKSAVALSDGLLLKLNRRELAAVIAHEISHIKNQDIRTLAIADAMNISVLSISIIMIVNFIITLPMLLIGESTSSIVPILLLIIASVLIFGMRMNLSRLREFEADRCSVGLTQDPEALISALNKLTNQHWRWLEKLFFSRERNTVPLLFRSHPENEDRIQPLIKLLTSVKKNRAPLNLSLLEVLIPKHLREIRRSLACE